MYDYQKRDHAVELETYGVIVILSAFFCALSIVFLGFLNSMFSHYTLGWGVWVLFFLLCWAICALFMILFCFKYFAQGVAESGRNTIAYPSLREYVRQYLQGVHLFEKGGTHEVLITSTKSRGKPRLVLRMTMEIDSPATAFKDIDIDEAAYDKMLGLLNCGGSWNLPTDKDMLRFGVRLEPVSAHERMRRLKKQTS